MPKVIQCDRCSNIMALPKPKLEPKNWARDLCDSIDSFLEETVSSLTTEEINVPRSEPSYLDLFNRLGEATVEAMMEKFAVSTVEYHQYFDEDAPYPSPL